MGQPEQNILPHGQELIRSVFVRLGTERCLSGVSGHSYLPETKLWAVVLLLYFVLA